MSLGIKDGWMMMGEFRTLTWIVVGRGSKAWRISEPECRGTYDTAGEAAKSGRRAEYEWRVDWSGTRDTSVFGTRLRWKVQGRQDGDWVDVAGRVGDVGVLVDLWD